MLCNDEKVPDEMSKLVKQKAKGILNGKGIYSYNIEEAKKWSKAFAKFNLEIYKVSGNYPPKTL